MKITVPYKLGIFSLGEQLPASQEGFCSMELVNESQVVAVQFRPLPVLHFISFINKRAYTHARPRALHHPIQYH